MGLIYDVINLKANQGKFNSSSTTVKKNDDSLNVQGSEFKARHRLHVVFFASFSIYYSMHIYRYILREHVGPFLFSFGTLMFIFLLQFLMKGLDQLVGKGLGTWVITELIIVNLAWMVVLAVPMSVLVATLMAFGNLSGTHEITAMKAAGVSIYRMLFPVVIASLVITYLLIEFDNKILPNANHRARILRWDIERKKPTFGITPGLFTQTIPGYSMMVRKTFEESNDLEGITIYDYTHPNENVVVTAKTGTMSFSDDHKKLIMDLREGEIHELDQHDYQEYRRVRFTKHRIITDVEGYEFNRTNEGQMERGDRELGADAMRVRADSLQRLIDASTNRIRESIDQHITQILDVDVKQNSISYQYPGDSLTRAIMAVRMIAASAQNEMYMTMTWQRQEDRYWVEIHKKYSIPVACFVFVFVGVPLGIMARRGGFGVAAGLSLGFFVFYWICLIGGEKLADRNLASPLVGMWIANIVLSVVGIYLVIRSLHETKFLDFSFFARFIPKRFRTDSQ